MRENIAVLDGLGMASDYDGYAGRSVTPEPSSGGNYEGGSNWSPFAPTLVSSEGLAGSLSIDRMSADGYAGGSVTPEPTSGGNYQGGSNWNPFTPTLVSSEGLAGSLSIESVPGYAGRSETPVPGNGVNYTGGSDWSPGFPTKIPSEGLVGLASLRGVSADSLRRWLTCGVLNAMRAIGISRSSGDIQKTVSRIISLGFPRGVALNARTCSYTAAFYTATQVGATARDARNIALRASLMCG